MELSSLKQSLASLTECSICLEPFNSPRSLPCQHCFCLPCLRALAVADALADCPVCRLTFSVPPGGLRDLPVNVYLDTLLAVRRALQQGTACDLHRDEQRAVYCGVCWGSACYGCYKAREDKGRRGCSCGIDGPNTGRQQGEYWDIVTERFVLRFVRRLWISPLHFTSTCTVHVFSCLLHLQCNA